MTYKGGLMYIQSLTLHNFGIYKGTHTLNFINTTPDKNVTLVGGMNGRGKTTILDSVFLALYGKRSIRVIQDKNISYHTLLFNHINKSATDNFTYIQLELIFEEENNLHLTIKREWSNDTKIQDILTIVKNGTKDEYLSENWDYYVEQILPLSIARFFFFDNEKISQIADDDSFNEIKDSIKSLIGITTIDTLITDMKKLLKSKNLNNPSLADNSLQQQRQAVEDELLELENTISQLFLERSGINQKFQLTLNNLTKAEEKFWKIGGELGLKKSELENKKAQLLDTILNLKQEALVLASSPSTPLALCKDLLTDSFNHLKEIEDKKALKYSEEIVSTLHSQLIKTFESQFNNSNTLDDIKNILDKEFKSYQVPDNIDLSLSLTPTSNLLLENLLSSGISTSIKNKKQLLNDLMYNTDALVQLEAHLNTNIEEAQSVTLLNNLRELEHKKGVLENTLLQKDNELNSLNYKKKLLENKLVNLDKNILSLKNSENDDERIAKYANMTIQVMQSFKLRQQEQKVSQLEQKIMHCFNYLAQKDSIISNVKIKSDTLDIILKDYNGNELLKDQLSAGEKQMFAISILWGLALSSGYHLPIIIDTPLARLDSAHRHNFVSKYLPGASKQVIVLSTDEEIYGSYLTSLTPYVSSFYTLLYNQEDKCTSIIPGYFTEV